MKILVVGGFAESLKIFRGSLLRDMVSAGCSVHAAAPLSTDDSDVGDYLESVNVRFHGVSLQRAGVNPVKDAMSFIALSWLIFRVRPEVIMAYTIKPVVYGVLAAWVCRVPRRYALITGLGYAFTSSRNGVTTRLAVFLYRLALKRATKVFFQNPDDEALFRSMGIIPSQIPSVVVNGSGIDVFHFYQVPPSKNLSFLLIARLLGDKGIREYVAAARKVKERFPCAVFRLAGWLDENPDSIERKELDSWITEGVIEYIGKLSDVRPAISECMVYVLPSYREGTPRTVLEAMAMGRAVITTDAPGCRETVIDGVNGFVVPVKSPVQLAEAMLRFADVPSLAVTMGAASRRIAEEKYDVKEVNKVMLREMEIVS